MDFFITLQAAAIVDHLCHKAETKLLDDDMKGLKKFSIKQQRMERYGSMEIDNESTTTEIKIKTERLDSAEIPENEEKRPKKHTITDESGEITESQPPAKIYKGVRYKTWSMGNIQPSTKFKKPTEREITEVKYYNLPIQLYLFFLRIFDKHQNLLNMKDPIQSYRNWISMKLPDFFICSSV